MSLFSGAGGGGTGGGFGGFGGSNNNNQPGNNGSVFGSGGGFGQPANNNSGFGNAGGFGQPNTSSTAFGAPAAPTNPGFGGGFGANNNNAASPFGAAKPFGATNQPASGGGLFGASNANNAAGSTGGFGFGGASNASNVFGGGNTAPASGGGLFGGAKPTFGAPATTSGTTGGLFGTANSGNTAFGNAANTGVGFGAGNSQAPLTGTASPPYQPSQEKEGQGGINNFQTIAFMPAYKNWSLEELRLQDYVQGRKYGTDSGNSGAFGQGTQFGAGFGANTNTAGFGAPNTNATGGGLFGNNNAAGTQFGGTNATNAFGGGGGAQAGGGLFGANKPASGGLFGSNAATTGGGLFGSNTATSGGGFGTGTGGFGTAAGAANTGGLFGANNSQQPQAKPFSFGNTGNTGFGTNAPATGFGGNTNAGGGGGLFGGGGAQATPGAFGAQSGTGFGTAGGAFGTATGQNPQGAGFGGFGANQQQPQQNKPTFGGFGAQPNATGGGGLFGNNNQQQQQQNPGGLFGGGDQNKSFGAPAAAGGTGAGLFGNNPGAAGSNTTGLFGGGQPAQAGQGGMFGGAGNAGSTGGGLFANVKPAGGLFLNTAPASNSGGPFGSSTAGGLQLGGPAGGGFFGQQPQQQQQQQGGGGVFGTSPFGSTQQGQQQQQQQVFTTSVMDSPYGGTMLNAYGSVQNSPMGPLATPLSSSIQTKKAAMIPHYKIAPRQPALAPRPGNSFSRSGSPFAASSAGNTPLGTSGSLGRSLSSNHKLHLFDNEDSPLISGSFTPNSSSRVASLKKLVIDKKIRDQDLFSGGQDLRKDSLLCDSPSARGTKGILKKTEKTVSFDIGSNWGPDGGLSITNGSMPALVKGKETMGPNPSAEEMGFMRSAPDRRGNREIENAPNGPPPPAPEEPVVGKEVAIVPELPKEKKPFGTYWMVPSAQKLRQLSRVQQKRVIGLSIGRRGYGQVSFDNPVDVTGIKDLDKIAGEIVIFDQRVCTVYPETMEKPHPGQGLNVPATITLEDCFPVSKNERGKIRDPEHPRFISHIRRLKGIKDTEYVNYLANEGMWIFRVRHFTTYGLQDDDDEEGFPEESAILSTEDSSAPMRTPGSALSLWGHNNDESNLDADISGADTTMGFDDTFDFKRLGSSAVAARPAQVQFPGSFSGGDSSYNLDESEDEGDITMDRQSFLGGGSVGSVEEMDEPAEPETGGEVEDSTVIMDGDTVGDTGGALVLAEPMTLRNPQGEGGNSMFFEDLFGPLPTGNDWTEQLLATTSPRKKRFGGESFLASTRKAPDSPGIMEPMSYGLLDLASDLYGDTSGTNGSRVKGKGRWGEFESPTASRSRHETTRSATGRQRHDEDDYDSPEGAERCWRNAIKPVWGKDGSIIFFGDIDGLGDMNPTKHLRMAKFRFSAVSAENQGTPKQLELQLKSTTIKRDEFNIPVADLNTGTLFHSFAQLAWSQDDPASQHEKTVWELASVLWDPIVDKPASEDETQELIVYMQELWRKERLTKFLEGLVEGDADKDVHGSKTLEEVALAHLTAHRIEQACAALLEAGDFRLASLISMIGGDPGLRQSITKQLDQWRRKGVLSEIPIAIRALYELLSGNTCFSEGVRGPPEDASPEFFIPQKFQLDWKRAFGLKLWYGCKEEEGIGSAVLAYEEDMYQYSREVPAPRPWYEYNLSDPVDEDAVDILWGLLRLYADRELTLEEVLAPMNSTTNIDYRLTWQLRTILAKKGVRDFSGGRAHKNPDGTEEFTSGSISDQVTLDFAGELETLGMWEWSIFVLIHLVDADSRETAVRNLLGKHIDELEAVESADVAKKLEFLEKSLLVPHAWICEARALQARSAGRHILEAEYLLSAHAWNEAHKTVVQQVAPAAVISGDLDQLKAILAKFENVDLVNQWNLGGQIYLDYIRLQEYMRGGKLHLPHPRHAETQRGLPRSNSPRDLARRLLAGLKNADRRGFLQNISIREMAGEVGSWVLKSPEMISEAPKLLDLPLTEDQYLRKTVNLSLAYYKARLQNVN